MVARHVVDVSIRFHVNFFERFSASLRGLTSSESPHGAVANKDLHTSDTAVICSICDEYRFFLFTSTISIKASRPEPYCALNVFSLHEEIDGDMFRFVPMIDDLSQLAEDERRLFRNSPIFSRRT